MRGVFSDLLLFFAQTDAFSNAFSDATHSVNQDASAKG